MNVILADNDIFEGNTVYGVAFGDVDNPKLFIPTENEDTIGHYIVESIYDDIQVGDSINPNQNDRIYNDFVEGKLKIYLHMTFTKSPEGVKGIESLMRNLNVVKRTLKDGVKKQEQLVIQEGFDELESGISFLKEQCFNVDESKHKQTRLQEVSRAFASARRALQELEIQARYNISKEGEY